MLELLEILFITVFVDIPLIVDVSFADFFDFKTMILKVSVFLMNSFKKFIFCLCHSGECKEIKKADGSNARGQSGDISGLLAVLLSMAFLSKYKRK